MKLKVTKKTENELSLICYVYDISLYTMHLKLSFKKYSSWLDFNKSLQLVQVTTQSYFDNWIHTVISLLNHYMCTNHRNTICHTVFGLWCHIIGPAVPSISKDHCAFIINALQSLKISAATHPMTGCYNPQNLNIH